MSFNVSAEVWLAMVRLLLTLLILWQNSQGSFATKENLLDMQIGKLYQTYAQSNTLLKVLKVKKTRLKRLLVYDRNMYSSKTKEDFARLHIY